MQGACGAPHPPCLATVFVSSRASQINRVVGLGLVATVRRVAVAGEEQRALFRRWPAGVSVVVAEAGGRKAGLTVSSLVSVSLEPPLVSISVAREASIFEVLDEAGRVGGVDPRRRPGPPRPALRANVPPLVQWDGIPARADEPLLLEGAVGWIVADTIERVELGDHVIFVGRGRRARARPRSGIARLLRPAVRGAVTVGRLRPRRRARRLRAGLGRRARGACSRARRPLAPRRAAGHDGHELARVVALHARADRPRGVARGDQPDRRRADARALSGRPAVDPRRARRRPARWRRASRSGSRPPRTAS